MKRFSFRPRLEALGKYVRDHPIFPFLPENALFWMFLLLLSIGSAMTLYGKVNGGGESRPANAPPEAAAYYYEYPPVSYTHLDVYKRQAASAPQKASRSPGRRRLVSLLSPVNP